MSTSEQQHIIIHGESAEELMGVKGFIQREMIRFGDQKAYIDKHYARLNVPSINTQFEIGKNKPMIAIKRKTEGYPLIGTAFWKGREYHITSETKTNIGPLKLTGGLSFAMKRPLGTDDAAEDKSFKMRGYDNYNSKDGQTFEYGAALGLEAFGLSTQGWYYTGKLIGQARY